jgi:hypothetical protein
MMIALVILSLIGAITALQVKKLIDLHRFENEVSNFFISLQEAQVFSSTYQTDIALDIFEDKGNMQYRFTTDEPFRPHQFNDAKVPLAHTVVLKFNNSKTNQLHFDLYSGGRIEPRGILEFIQSKEEGSKSLWIDLQLGFLLKYSSAKPAISKQKTPGMPKDKRVL